MKMKPEMLLDTWEVQGNDVNELYGILHVIDTSTSYAECPSVDIFTLRKKDEDTIDGFYHDGQNDALKTYDIAELIRNHGATEQLLDELDSNSKMMLSIKGGHLMFTSGNILTTLSQRGGTPIGESARRGEITLRFYRDATYRTFMELNKKMLHIVYRTADNDARKALAVFTDYHSMISQEESVRCAIDCLSQALGTPGVSYKVTNDHTGIYLTFPEKARDFSNVMRDGNRITLPDEVIPSVYIQTSDGGDVSFKVNGNIRVGSNIIGLPDSKDLKKHTKNASVEKIKEGIMEKVFPEFISIPNRLYDLICINIPRPDVAVVEKVAKHCAIKKMLGLGVQNEVIRNISESLNPNIPCTAYDIASMFADEASRLVSKCTASDQIQTIRSCLGNAYFYRYENL